MNLVEKQDLEEETLEGGEVAAAAAENESYFATRYSAPHSYSDLLVIFCLIFEFLAKCFTFPTTYLNFPPKLIL